MKKTEEIKKNFFMTKETIFFKNKKKIIISQRELVMPFSSNYIGYKSNGDNGKILISERLS